MNLSRATIRASAGARLVADMLYPVTEKAASDAD